MDYQKFHKILGKVLQNECSADELNEFHSSLEKNPNLKESYDKIKKVWDFTAKPDQDFLNATYELHLTRLEQAIENRQKKVFRKPIRLKFIKLGVGSLGILTLLIVGFFIIKKDYFSPNSTIQKNNFSSKEPKIASNFSVATTNIGNKKFIELIDGTKVWLNSCSNLKHFIKLNNDFREVFLEGEAYFEVKKDANHPFIIHTSTIDIKVLGTKFNVRCYKNEKKTETSLTQGKVEVQVKNRPGDVFILKPNEKLVVQNSHIETEKLDQPELNNIFSDEPIVEIKPLVALPIKNTAIISETAWTNNALIFNDESFEEISQILQREFGYQFKFVNLNRQNIKIHAVFVDKDFNDIITALSFTFDFTYKLENNIIYIY